MGNRRVSMNGEPAAPTIGSGSQPQGRGNACGRTEAPAGTAEAAAGRATP